MRCPECGGILAEVDLLGDLLTYRCSSCGRETWSSISRPIAGVPDIVEEWNVIVEWRNKDRPSSDEILAVRREVEWMARLPLTEAADALRATPRLLVATLNRREAAELSQTLERRGLHVKLELQQAQDKSSQQG